ncbi:hypothetical protein [Rhodanobacter sp. BL-MT-08]
MESSVIAKQLKTSGYSVVRGFLSNIDVSPALLEHLSTAEKFLDGVINRIPNSQMQAIRNKINNLIPEVADQLGIDICRDRFSYCAIRIQKSHELQVIRKPFDAHRDPKIGGGGVLNWHVDHFSYYLYGDHKNWLICYMPVIKPSKQLANLAIIPSDVLQTQDPELARKIHGRGAMRFRCAEADTIDWFRLRFPDEHIQVGDWFAIDDYLDSTMGWKINIDLEKHKTIPELDVHDLLIMRADVIHRTADAGSNRISIRCDAIPNRAPRIHTFIGLMSLTIRYPFVGSKRRYNLKNWLKNEWRKRLRRSP